jgi:hypothetical protein
MEAILAFAVQYATAAAAIIGLVNGVRLIREKDFWGFAFFMLAIVAGILFGYYHWLSLPSAEVGFMVGLASSGVYRYAQVRAGTARPVGHSA